jgi:hypothetical protein
MSHFYSSKLGYMNLAVIRDNFGLGRRGAGVAICELQ